MSVAEVIKIIRSMPTKTCESDTLPTRLLKQSLDKLGETITAIVNISLRDGVFAKTWKEVIVHPLLKKPGLELVAANYRPVSNLPFISKVVEKCMLTRLNKHCDDNNLLPEYQSAYRKNYSCETALVKLMDDILWSMEIQEVTAVVAIDLSAAFDTVDHNILLNVLEDRFGIKDSSLKWVDSYLRPRSLRVCVGDAYSSVRSLDFSVPQGSGASPSFYSAYASTMRDIVPATVDIHGYADDHALKKAFKASSRTDEITSIASLRSVIFDIKSWMDENRLKMNNSKTEFILFGSRQQLAKLTTTTIDINGVLINRSPSIRYLGADLDERLTLGGMITRKCRVAMGINLQKLKLIRKCLTLSAATTVALGLVIAHLDYANALYSGLPAVEIQKLQRIQNMTAKIITGVNKHASSTTALKSLHWLPIRLRIEFKIATLVFRSLHGLAPSYLRDLIRPVSVTRRGLRSQTKACILEVPFTRRKTFADRAFSTYGPRTWNLLPEDLRSLTDYQLFKKKLICSTGFKPIIKLVFKATNDKYNNVTINWNAYYIYNVLSVINSNFDRFIIIDKKYTFLQFILPKENNMRRGMNLNLY